MARAEPYAGRVAGLSIRAWIESYAREISTLPYVLISSVDSDREVSAMGWVLSRRAEDPSWAISLDPLVISGVSTVSLLPDRNLWTGFDELWIPVGLPVAAPTLDASLVAPLDLDVESPQKLWAWLDSSAWRLGVGDGYGLNYVVTDSALGHRLGLDRPSQPTSGSDDSHA
jgi:hypothetical protein